jgi:hypothetical protein
MFHSLSIAKGTISAESEARHDRYFGLFTLVAFSVLQLLLKVILMAIIFQQEFTKNLIFEETS